jgi:hypothetical protein
VNRPAGVAAVARVGAFRRPLACSGVGGTPRLVRARLTLFALAAQCNVDTTMKESMRIRGAGPAARILMLSKSSLTSPTGNGLDWKRREDELPVDDPHPRDAAFYQPKAGAV